MPAQEDIEKITRELTEHLTKKGKLIEAGFAAFKLAFLNDAPKDQIDDMRVAFMAGAEHLFDSIMTILDPGEEPTAADMHRMDMIAKEVAEWREAFKRYTKQRRDA